MATNHSPPPDISLADVLDIAAFQNLTDSFSRLTGIATAILDIKGKILVASSWQPICTEFHRKNPFTAQRCLESDTALANQLAQGKKYNVYQCKNGLVDVAAPIILNNRHVGNIFAGQFFFAPPDIDFFLRQAEQFDFAKEEYLGMLSQVPVIAEEKMRQVMSFLTDLTTILGKSAIDKKELLHLNKNLEQLVQARTLELKEELAIRKAAELEIQKSHMFLESIFDAIQDGISVLDSDLRVVRINKVLQQWYPHIDSFIGRKCHAVYHGSAQPCGNCPSIRTLCNNSMESAEIPLLSAEQKVIGTLELFSFPIRDGLGNVQGVVEYLRNITERKRIENKIKEEMRFSDSLINSLPGVMYLFDQSGNFKRWNKNFEKVAGYPPEQLGLMSPLDFIAAEDKSRVEEAIEKVFRDGWADVEAGFLTSDGRVLPHLFTGYRFAQDSLNYLVGIGLDISDRVRVEQEKEDLIASLQESFKKVKQLSGFLPICASCKRIRDDEGYWNQIEWYIREHSEVEFSHGICPDCAKKLYPDIKFSED